MGVGARRVPRPGENIMDKLWRLRSIAIIILVPVLLFLAVAIFMPRGPPTSHFLEPAGPAKYAIVIDAGSTGSRVHAFHFTELPSGQFELVKDNFHQLKPGLSSFASDPDKGAESLRPLLEKALAIVPKDLQASTTVQVRATAGLRLLPGDQASKLLSAVRSFLGTFPFAHDASSVSIMDGADEGAFQWLTINYLLGNLGKDLRSTVAAIDLGGGSVQLAHAIPDVRASKAPPGYVRPLHGNGKVYDVYVHSYLGYGLMAGRAAVLGLPGAKAQPCVTAAEGINYSYSGKSYLLGAGSARSAEGCAKAAADSLNADKACAPAPQAECAFDGAWGGAGGEGTNAFYVSSYFWDRATAFGIADGNALSAAATAGAFGKAAESVCAQPAESLPAQYPAVSAGDAPFMCLDLSFCHGVLTRGFRLPPSKPITLVKQIKYRGEATEAAWPLGAAIDSMSKAKAEEGGAGGPGGVVARK